jgi:hypothetical protein
VTLRAWFALLVFVALTMPHGLAAAQSAAPDIVTARGTVVSRGASPGTWLFELDRGFDVVAGHVRSVSLFVDEASGPAHPIGVGDRLEVEGRLLTPTLPGDVGTLLPTRITQLSESRLTHAYFLFRSGKSEGCAECYVPLLLSAAPLESSSPATPEFEVIVTYERDSIWEIRDRLAVITEVEPKARTLRLDGRPYRYQEVSPDEAIRLLKNPLGSIPISRPGLVDAPTSTRRRALLLRMGVRDP